MPPKHTTRCHRLRNRKNSLPLVLYFFWSSSTQWILSSTSITVLSIALCWVSRTKPIRRIPESPSWKLMSKGEREITSKLVGERDHIKGEKQSQGPNLQERSQGGREYSRIPDAWCSRGEMPHVFLGERHVHMNSFELSSIQLWFSVSYLLPISHVRFRGSKTPKGTKSVKFIAYLYSWGHVESNVVPCTHSLHVIPVLAFLWFLLFPLASGCTCVI